MVSKIKEKEMNIKLELATFCYKKYLETGEEVYLDKASWITKN